MVQGYLGLLAARHGDREEALRISERLDGMADPYDFGREEYLQACIAAQLSDLDRAMTLLRDYPPFQEFIKPRG